MFKERKKGRANLVIYAKPTTFTTMFDSAATDANALITVYYHYSVDNIDTIIATKSAGSNVVKGGLIGTDYTITLNANGGTVSPTSITITPGQPYMELPIPTTTQAHTEFVGWFTDPVNGIEVTYNTMPSNITEIYAHWHYYPEATFRSGTAVNIRVKKLAGNTDATSETYDTNITQISKANALPQNFVADDTNTLSIGTSDEPIYAWYDNGIIYYYTDAEKIYLNTDASYMFFRLKNVSQTEGLESWDASNVTSLRSAFSYLGVDVTADFNMGDLSSWDVSHVQNMTSTFYLTGQNASSWNVGDLSGWDTSSATSMGYMFCGAGQKASSINLDLSNWDVSHVHSMTYMFSSTGKNATTYCSIGDLSNWDVSNVENMEYMFYHVGESATTFSLGDLSNWDTSKVDTMQGMFISAGVATQGWNIGNLKIYADNINNIFRDATKLSAVLTIYNKPSSYTNAFNYAATSSNASITVNYTSDVDNIDDIIATKSSGSHVYKGESLDSNFTVLLNANGGTVNPTSVTITPGQTETLPTPTTTQAHTEFLGWYTDPVNGLKVTYNTVPYNTTEIYAHWAYHPEATFVDGSNFNIKLKRLSGSESPGLNTDNTNIERIVKAKVLPRNFEANTDNTLSLNTSDEPIYAWYDNGTLYYYTDAETIYLHTYSNYMFYLMKRLESIEGTNEWNTSNTVNMASIFYATGTLVTGKYKLDISNWDTSNVENMAHMFHHTGNQASEIKMDLSKWNVSQVEDMSYMFTELGAIATTWNIGSLSSWDVSSVETMEWMFCYAAEKTAIFSIGDLSGWNTSNVTNMRYMFFHVGKSATAWSIGTLKIYADNIEAMFNSCIGMKGTLEIYNMPTSYSGVFAGATIDNNSTLIVNYTSAVSGIDDIIANKSSGSHITKGSLITV